jgi:hypothetical protein
MFDAAPSQHAAVGAQGEPIYVYEWDCGPGVVHRDFEHCSYNGRYPDRTLTLYRDQPHASDAPAGLDNAEQQQAYETGYQHGLARAAYTHAMGEAASKYYARFVYAHPLPAQFRWSEVYDAMIHASGDAPATAAHAEASLTSDDVERQYSDGVHIGSGLPRATCPCGFCAKHRFGFNKGDVPLRAVVNVPTEDDLRELINRLAMSNTYSNETAKRQVVEEAVRMIARLGDLLHADAGEGS